MRLWFLLPLFWRFQLAGWVTYVLLSFPLKAVIFGSFRSAIIVSIARDGLIFLLTVGMREIYRRFCCDWTRLFHIFIVIFPTSAFAGLILTGFSFVLFHVFQFRDEVTIFVKTGFQIFYTHAGLCFSWSLLYFGIKSIRVTAKRDVELARAEVALREAELQVLKTQINSHFLFNALNAIWAELGKNQQVLKNLVQALADYLRYSLVHRHENTVRLEDEFEVMLDYLTVEKVRFGNKLDVGCQIDEAARKLPVPSMILQPLVENAIKFGQRTSESVLSIRVLVTLPEPGTIMIEVANTGTWVDPERKIGYPNGLGLENLRRRLSLLFPGRHSFEILCEYGWVTIRLQIETSFRQHHEK